MVLERSPAWESAPFRDSVFAACRGPDQIRSLRATPCIAAEMQHVVSTRKLVASRREQLLLDALLDGVRAPSPPDARGLHDLLAAPFRTVRGSRFGAPFARGVWYGSLARRTALAEFAHSRRLLLEGARTDLSILRLDVGIFRVRVATRRGIDLTRPPFDAHASVLTSPSSTIETQALGRAMREAGVEAFRFQSTRDPQGGVKVGVLAPSALTVDAPRQSETFHVVVTSDGGEAFRREIGSSERLFFPR